MSASIIDLFEKPGTTTQTSSIALTEKLDKVKQCVEWLDRNVEKAIDGSDASYPNGPVTRQVERPPRIL